MIAVIQRVFKASVTVNKKEKRSIGKGLVVLVGVENDDGVDDINWLASKIVNLRIFNDEDGIMNDGLLKINGDIMIISQFTLHASTKKGNRPSYINAAKPEVAVPIYEKFIKAIGVLNVKKIISGEFGAHMDISLVNDGPVTIVIDTKDRK